MNTLAIIGLMWGDEGKGKITDYILEKADVAVRSQGGNNAGHTVVKNGKKYKLSLLPSSVLNKKAISIMANGMVINPEALFNEIENLKKLKISVKNLFISHKAHVIFPYHIQMDELNEELKKHNAVETTKKGIGPCYEDKVSRAGIRVEDLFDKKVLFEKIEFNLLTKNVLFEKFDKTIFNAKTLTDKYLEFGKKIKPLVTDTSVLLNKLIKENKKVLFEAAQGSMLCIEHGTYPYVTSSSPTPSSIPVNAGIGLNKINKVLGITKAYTTRVGNGPFPTEIKDEIASKIREVGREYGTVTGRPRRIGWLDLTIIKYDQSMFNVDYLSLMLLDVLTGISEIKVCTHYMLNGKKIEYLPSNSEMNNIKPVYVTFDGWKEDITKIKTFAKLPLNCQKFVKFIQKEVRIPIAFVSVGPDQKQTIVLKKIW